MSTYIPAYPVNLDSAIAVDDPSAIKPAVPAKFADMVNYDPMSLREYIVIVKPGQNISTLEEDLERDTSQDHTVDSAIIPDRVCDVAHRRPGSDTQTHYWLNDREAADLKKHPMVLDVEWAPSENPFIEAQPHAIKNQNFERAGLFGASGGDRANFGLYRCSTNTNTYGTGIGGYANYEYILDGSGVDVVIMDDGVQVDHPEFIDEHGNSRVQTIDWYEAAGIAGIQPINFYTPGDHGTHVAGIVAGKTFGWAKKARIYSMNSLGTGAIDAIVAFDLIKLFHRNKPIDPVTRRKRPTIVNASWSYTKYLGSTGGNYDPIHGIGGIFVGYQIWGGNYRGTAWSGYTMNNTDYGLNGTAVLVQNAGNGADTDTYFYRVNGRSTAADAVLEEMISEGVHYVTSSGNDDIKCDVPGGLDYDNSVQIVSFLLFIWIFFETYYYNRPASPYSANATIVGAVSANSYDATLERRGHYSNYGPAISVYSPGTGIVSAWSSNNSVPYYYDHQFYQQNESGTSMASPQVTGVTSLFLQLSPGATPAAVKNWITTTALDGELVDTGLTDDYSVSYSLSGGPNKFLHNPYAVASVSPMKNGITITSGFVNLKS
jgi:subtilisin family serine protease